MVEYLQNLGGIEVEMYQGAKDYSQKTPGRVFVNSRHATMGTYVTVKDTRKNKILFDQHSSQKNFTWNLGQTILDLAN